MAGKLTMAVLAMMAAVSGIMAFSRERVVIMEVLMEKNMELMKAVNTPNLPNLPALVDQLGLSDLYSAVVSASLGEALSAEGPFTLFAPTNAAFAKDKAWVAKLSKNVTALKEVLTYHVLKGKVMSKDIKDELTLDSLNGKPIRFNLYPATGTKLVTAQCAPINLKKVDVMASNGVLHELTALMVPPVGTIVDAAVGLKADFSTLVKALTIASLVETLSGKGPFTVFAPTNAAFSKLDPKVLDYLLHNVTALKNVLTYHVVSMTYCPAGLQFYKELKMVNGQTTKISGKGDSIQINNIPVLPIGVEGSVTNGVIHKIETVLIPPSLQILPEFARFLAPYHTD